MIAVTGVSASVVHTGVQAISAGYSHSMMLKQDGSVWATGYNRNGQLGDGTTTSKTSFVKVVSSGQCRTMVLTTRAHGPTLVSPPTTYTDTHTDSPSQPTTHLLTYALRYAGPRTHTLT